LGIFLACLLLSAILLTLRADILTLFSILGKETEHVWLGMI
jgi:hypothetical protein